MGITILKAAEELKVLIVDSTMKMSRRNYYERKRTPNGNHFYAYFNGKAYSFQFEDEKAINIIDEGNYKEFAIKVQKDSIAYEHADDAAPESIPTIETIEAEATEIRHEKYEAIKMWVSMDVPVYLVGPAGSGKNHTLEQIAKALSLDFYFTNSVQQEYKLTGFIDAGGKYHETEFYKAFTLGGLFFLDEMDASVPEVLVLLNAAIANKYFEFPTGKVVAHEKFRVVAAGNTVGSGSDDKYTGRLTLDQATLDRFAIVEFDYSERIELHLAKGNKELVDFIHSIRKQADTTGIRATFSYRCITMVTKAEKSLPLDQIMVMAVFKGMDKDTIKNFRDESYDTNKYFIAMKKVQRGA